VVVKNNSVFWAIASYSPLTTKDNTALYPIGDNISKYFLVMSSLRLDHSVTEGK
jgi:hypothetical protein